MADKSPPHIQKASERLVIYQKALADFRRVYYIPIFWTMKYSGFCYYFEKELKMQDIMRNEDFKQRFPELWSTNPKVWYQDSGYWFNPTRVLPRIKCLKKAIRITKNKINGSNR